MQLCSVVIRLQFLRYKRAGAMDMAEIFIKIIPEKTVQPGIHILLAAQMQRIGNVLRLHMECGGMGHAHFLSDMQPSYAEPEGKQEMHQIRPANGFLKHLFIRLGKNHSLLCYDMVYDRRQEIFLHQVLTIAGISCTDHSDLMSVCIQRVRQALGSHCGSVISSVILIDN